MGNKPKEMNESNEKESREETCSSVNEGEQEPCSTKGKGEKKRGSRIDRSSYEISEETFLSLPRNEQLTLLRKYWEGPSDLNDEDRKFKFSQTHLADLALKNGFRKGVYDVWTEEKHAETIWLERKRNSDTVERKFTIERELSDKLDHFLGSKVSNVEKSKIINELLKEVVNEKLEMKNTGKLRIAYKKTAEEEIEL